MSEESIKLTGTTLTVIALHIDQNTSHTVYQQLSDKIQQSQQFFQGSSIVIDLGGLPAQDINIDLNELVAHCKQLGLQPIAFKQVDASLESQLPLPVLPVTQRVKEKELILAEPVVERIVTEVVTETVIEEKWLARPTKMIQRPIRSGQQEYSEGDLIILGQVSEGAEIIAEGNIHVYGSLRGRALAGVKGDMNANIFCQHLDAELLSIAGHFLLSDSIDSAMKKQAAQISLQDETLKIVAIK